MTPNLAYLEKQWLDKSGARRAFEHKRRRSAEDLQWLLRHHDEATVYQPDTDYRDDFDRLLMFYGIVEIAITVGFVEGNLPPAFKRKHLTMLADPAVRHYYEWNYPLDLPRRLRERLQTGVGYDVPRTRELTSLYYEFLELAKPIERDEALQAFLWALDDGYTEIDISDVRKALKKPQRLLRAVLKKPGQQTDLDIALNGFCKFVSFCQSFERLLKRIPDRIVAEAMWLAHAYWFRRFGSQIGGNLRAVFRTIASWEVKKKDTRRLAKRVTNLNRTIASLAVSPLSQKPLFLETQADMKVDDPALLDVNLPKLSVYEVVAEIKKGKPIEELFEGVNIPEPFTAQDLIEKIKFNRAQIQRKLDAINAALGKLTEEA